MKISVEELTLIRQGLAKVVLMAKVDRDDKRTQKAQQLLDRLDTEEKNHTSESDNFLKEN